MKTAAVLYAVRSGQRQEMSEICSVSNSDGVVSIFFLFCWVIHSRRAPHERHDVIVTLLYGVHS